MRAYLVRGRVRVGVRARSGLRLRLRVRPRVRVRVRAQRALRAHLRRGQQLRGSRRLARSLLARRLQTWLG